MNMTKETTTRGIVAAALCLGAALSASATSWTYSLTDRTITDGQWTLIVSSFDKSTGTIKLGNNSTSCVKSRTDPDEESKSGVLDLRSPLYIDDGTGDGATEFTKVKFSNFAFANATGIVEFYCDVIDEMGTACFNQCTGMTTVELGGTAETLEGIVLNRCTSLKTVKIDFPNLRRINDYQQRISFLGEETSPDPIDIATIAVPCVTNIGACALANSKLYGDVFVTNLMFLGKSAFNGSSVTNVYLAGPVEVLPQTVFQNSTVTNVVLDFPNLTNVANHVFYNRKTLTGDIMDILKPGVVDIGGCAFYNCYELTGTLTLTNVHTIGAQSFYACYGLTEIYLAGSCSEIPKESFYDCKGLKNATFDLAENATVASQAFGKWNPPAFEEIWFLRKPFGAASMTNLLFNATGSRNARPLTAENACKVYVSKQQWPAEERAACEWWRPATAATLSEEELAAKPDGCIGVAEIVLSSDSVWADSLRGTTQRAWIVHRQSPYDKTERGFVIVVR